MNRDRCAATGEMLKRWRLHSRLTMYQVAKQMGVVDSRIAAIEAQARVTSPVLDRYVGAILTCLMLGSRDLLPGTYGRMPKKPKLSVRRREGLIAGAAQRQTKDEQDRWVNEQHRRSLADAREQRVQQQLALRRQHEALQQALDQAQIEADEEARRRRHEELQRDVFAVFARECLVVDKMTGGRARETALYADLAAWCRSNVPGADLAPLLAGYLRTLGARRVVTKDCVFWVGVRTVVQDREDLNFAVPSGAFIPISNRITLD
jgi:transcriptional regulator with XRE-family HTH domain